MLLISPPRRAVIGFCLWALLAVAASAVSVAFDADDILAPARAAIAAGTPRGLPPNGAS